MSTKPSTPADEESKASSGSYSYSAAYSPTTAFSPNVETVDENDTDDHGSDEEDGEDDDTDSDTTVKINEILEHVNSQEIIQTLRDDESIAPGLLERIEQRQATIRAEARLNEYFKSPPIRNSSDEEVVETVKKIDSLAQQIQETRKNPENLKTPRKPPAVPPAGMSFSPTMSFNESPYPGARLTGRGSSNGDVEYRVGPEVSYSQYYDPSSMTFLAPPPVQDTFQVPLTMTYEMLCAKKYRDINAFRCQQRDSNAMSHIRASSKEH